MLSKTLAALSFAGLASAFHGTGYEVEPYSDPGCLDYWGEKRCVKMAGKGFCVSDDECPSDKTFRCSKTRQFCAGTCGTCPAKCAVPDAVEGVYGGAIPVPGTGGALEFPFFLKFQEGYGTLYMYGDKMSWCAAPPPQTHATPAPLPAPSNLPPPVHTHCTPPLTPRLPPLPHASPSHALPLTPSHRRSHPVAVSPSEFGCAMWLNADGSAGLAYFLDDGSDDFPAATGGDAPLCATLTAGVMGVDSIDYGAYWALAEQVEGGFFFKGVEGSIDLSGGYGTASAVWAVGVCTGEQCADAPSVTVPLAALALDVTAGGVAPFYADSDDVPDLWTAGLESVAQSFVFTEGKVCYTAPPLWNGMYPDAYAAYAGSIGASLCLDKIE